MREYTFRWVYEGFETLENEETILAFDKDQAERALRERIGRFFPNYVDKVKELTLFAIG